MAAFADMSQADLEAAIVVVDAAITRSLNATSYQIGSRQLARASLKDLMALRSAYVRQLQAITGADIGVVAFEDGGGDTFNSP